MLLLPWLATVHAVRLTHHVEDLHVPTSHYYLISAKLKDFSFTRDVEEGGWANYSCTIKSIKKASIFWRIGDYTSEGGDSIQQVCNLKEINVQVKSADNTEKIDILATMELNGMPVQCKVVPYVITSRAREEYSQFALLRVHPSNGLGRIT